MTIDENVADTRTADLARRAWRRHEYEQLVAFRALSLREKIEAIEAMAEVVDRLNEARQRSSTGSVD
jgi:hypothetical protein